MRDERCGPFAAAAGAIAIVLFLAGSLVIGERPRFDAAGAEVARFLEERRSRIQSGSALLALAAPFLVWFLATVASLAGAAGEGARRAGSVAYGCGLVFLALFLADVTTLVVGALRPGTSPELAVALRDFEFLAMGMAAPLGAGVLAACAVLVLRHGAVWPDWVGRLAAVAAVAYLLRVGTLFTTTGALAADGVLGLLVPVVALAGWILVASVVLVGRARG
jgi:hypothetical protein